MAATKVTTLAALQALVKSSGDAEEVEVDLGDMIKLCDASAMRKLLRKMIQSKGWKVNGLTKLKPLESIAKDVNGATGIVCGLIRMVDPNVDRIVLNFSTDKSEDRLHALAKKLERHCKVLVATDIEDAKDLREELIVIAKEIRAKHRKGNTVLHYMLCEAKECGNVYNHFATPVPDDSDSN